MQESVYARTAQAVAPVFTPAGFGTWETTSALIVGFVAKEAVISSWAQTYSAEEPGTSEEPGTLGSSCKADFEESSGGHTSAAVWAFLVFLLAYTPCVATLAAQRREIGTRWTVFGVAMQLSVAWVARWPSSRSAHGCERSAERQVLAAVEAGARPGRPSPSARGWIPTSSTGPSITCCASVASRRRRCARPARTGAAQGAARSPAPDALLESRPGPYQ